MNSTIKSKKNEKNTPEKEKNKKTSPTTKTSTSEKKVENEKQIIENLEKSNKELLNQVETLKVDKLRLLADLDNQKKTFLKEMKEIGEALKYNISKKLIEKILPLFDSYERAAQIDQAYPDPKVKKFLAGFQIALARFQKDFFQEEKIEEIKIIPQTNLSGYNSNEIEIIDSEENNDYPEGTILQVSQKGYRYQGKVLRPAEVIISKKKG